MERNKGSVKVPSLPLLPAPPCPPHSSFSFSSSFSSFPSSFFSFFQFLFLLPLRFIQSEMFYCCQEAIYLRHDGLMSPLLKYIFLKRLMRTTVRNQNSSAQVYSYGNGEMEISIQGALYYPKTGQRDYISLELLTRLCLCKQKMGSVRVVVVVLLNFHAFSIFLLLDIEIKQLLFSLGVVCSSLNLFPESLCKEV